MPRILDTLKSAPGKVAARGDALRNRAQQRVHALRLDGEARLFHFRLTTLERADALLDKAPSLPVVRTVTGAAERLVERRLHDLAAPHITDYDTLNAKDVIDAIRDLSYTNLLRVQRWEQQHKARKTVQAAVEKEIARRETIPDILSA